MRGRLAAFAIGRAAGKNASAPQPTVSESKSTSELEDLVKMHESGELTDEEFSKAKKKLLAK